MRDGIGYGMRPRARVVWRATVTNGDLVHTVAAVAKAAARMTRWPEELDPNDAARIAWQYVRDRTVYYPERGDQWIRTPRAFVREGIGDCKTTAVFIGALAAAAGHDVQLKFTRSRNRGGYGHVYAVVDGVPVDPLLPFGSECLHLASHTIRIA